ncbi:Subtilisin-like protease preproenzyme [Heracleum sosnowskyi]|uniref:Subtilisin-like protease preproenzyme n=1 Tax=Heracleum sosnowskyi TaxID=360622 RepID=A0AAD8MZI2_9APIA|nr:Subtilisin-like protease preproenzyme [Heracleum sosnowskyi]
MAAQFQFGVCLLLITISQFISTSLAHKTSCYIVHMDLSAMPKAYSSHHSWYLATLASITDNSKFTRTSISSSSKIIYTYTHVMHGFSAILSDSELESISSSPGYVSSFRDVPVKLDTTYSFKFLGLNSNYGAWPESKYGKDVIIGLVDTGIWPESKSYDDYGMTPAPLKWKGACEIGTQFNSSLCNKKLVGARYFSKGLLANNPNLTISMNSPRDTDGHGTHTSSTAAGNYVDNASYFGYAYGTARGMAPHARVAMYKALFDEGSVSSDILAAIDQAIEDGVDVLSLSFGLDGAPLFEDPVAIATFAAIEKGIFVSTSAGNEGPFLETLHNGTPWVLTVAAGSIDREYVGNIILGNGVIITGQTLYPSNLISRQNFPLVFMGECNDVEKIGKKFVVCQDKNGTLSEQVYACLNAHVSGGIFITNNSDVGSFRDSSFPALFLNQRDGEIILNYIKMNQKAKASFEFQKTSVGSKVAPKVAPYSSRGPSGSCPFVLKPDIMGPGDLILASWPSNVAATEGSSQYFSDFNLLSGTSMACPHVAGVAALLRGVHPKWSPAAIRSAMMTTADFLDNKNNPILDGALDHPATPLAFGAGHINPNKALNPGLIYDVNAADYINLLCALNYTSRQIQTVTRTVTNVGDKTSVYKAKIKVMDGLMVNVVPDKLIFRNKYETQSYKLSIQGPRMMKNKIIHGSITWVELTGRHHVRSPIVATHLSSQILGGKI